MTAANKVAVVTGANRGLGLETCRQLARQGYQVVLTSRNPALGQAAADTLASQGLKVVYHPLDMNDLRLAALHTFVRREFGRVDVLVNNAGVYLDEDRAILDVPLELFWQTFQTNVWGALATAQEFIPAMLKNGYGRVVNVSSGMGEWASLGADSPAYSLSKTALNAITVMLADATRRRNVLVNAVCPGWVRTDMGGGGASRSVEQGAETIVWLATLPDGGPHGRFFRDRQPIPW
jgi:NAD(P)-dependent dehydrogenase (short-subunit alcohol dehydrogenase family)